MKLAIWDTAGQERWLLCWSWWQWQGRFWWSCPWASWVLDTVAGLAMFRNITLTHAKRPKWNCPVYLCLNQYLQAFMQNLTTSSVPMFVLLENYIISLRNITSDFFFFFDLSPIFNPINFSLNLSFRFRNITAAYYRGAQGVVLVYDITNRKSFEKVLIDMWRTILKSIRISSTGKAFERLL